MKRDSLHCLLCELKVFFGPLANARPKTRPLSHSHVLGFHYYTPTHTKFIVLGDKTRNEPNAGTKVNHIVKLPTGKVFAQGRDQCAGAVSSAPKKIF
jgi:hypothetical protein